jgi:hypothetical protein
MHRDVHSQPSLVYGHTIRALALGSPDAAALRRPPGDVGEEDERKDGTALSQIGTKDAEGMYGDVLEDGKRSSGDATLSRPPESTLEAAVAA